MGITRYLVKPAAKTAVLEESGELALAQIDWERSAFVNGQMPCGSPCPTTTGPTT